MGMEHPKKPEFDQYAGRYDAMHRESIRASGEPPEYFAAYKATYIGRHMRKQATAGGQAIEVLDFGCGVGNSLAHLRREFPDAKIHGADPSAESIRRAEAAYPLIASLATIDGDRLPYNDDQFDIVLAACVFHHIPPVERARWMGEIVRVLKPGGHSFVFEHNALNPLTMKAVRDCPFDEDAILLPRRELLSLSRDAGLDEATARYIVFFPHALATFRGLEPSLGWLPLGAQYVVSGRKK